MNYIKQCAAGYLISLSFIALSYTSCSSSKINPHLEALKSINSQIDKQNWDVFRVSVSDIETYYILKKRKGDTAISFCFSYFKNGGEGYYKLDDYVKSFSNSGKYYEMALLNSDTVYFFETTKDSTYDEDTRPNYKNYIFIIGKYYYHYSRGKLRNGQRLYFEKHKDSLLEIRGNDLNELPEIEENYLDTIPFSTETSTFSR